MGTIALMGIMILIIVGAWVNVYLQVLMRGAVQ